nr:hypothetical protein [Tanacetum cinerariifolium]
MFKLDLEHLVPKLLQNKEAHIDYRKYTQEQADILWVIVEQAKAKHPLDNVLDFAYKHTQRIQELLVYVRDTCPNAINLSAEKVVFTPKNKFKKVRSSKQMTGNRSQLVNFVSKFLSTVRFGNDHIARIMRISDQTSVARTPQQNDVVKKRNRTLVEAARTIDDWDHLFQPMFNEYFNLLTFAVSPAPVAAAPRAVDLAHSLVSTLIDQDSPSTSIPSTQEQEHSLSIFQDKVFLIKLKWIYKVKKDEFGRVLKNKARLVAQENAAHKNMTIFQMDVKTAFLNGELKEEEDFMYQADNKEISSASKEHMPYPRFTKVIIHHFIYKDNTISMRNRISLHTTHDDTLLGTLKFVSKTKDYQKYRALIPDSMINQDIKDSKAYKTYLDYATRKVPPKKARKFKKPASPKLKTVPNTSKGTGVKPEVHDMSKEDSSDSDDDSWGDSEDENDDVHDEDDNDDDDGNDDNSGNDDDDGERDKSDDEDKMYEEEDDDIEKELYEDLNITQGLRDIDMTNAEQGGEDQQNASHESGFVQEEEDSHVTLTTVHDKTEGPLQSSFFSSEFTSKLLNLDDPSPDINSLMNTLTVLPPPFPIYPSSHPTTIPQQQIPDSTTTITYLTINLPVIPNFASLFQFDQRVSALETKVSEFNQTSQFLKLSPQFQKLSITILPPCLKKK